MKPWTEARNYKYMKYHSKLTHQLSFWNVSRKDTERTRFCPQTYRRTDGQGETSIPPFQRCWSGGYKMVWRTDRRTDWTIHRAAWSQLKIWNFKYMGKSLRKPAPCLFSFFIQQKFNGVRQLELVVCFQYVPMVSCSIVYNELNAELRIPLLEDRRLRASVKSVACQQISIEM